MYPLVQRRKTVGPPFYNNYDSVDRYRNFPGYDAIPPAYGYGYGLGYNLGLSEYVPPTHGVESATRAHVAAQKDFESAKDKFEEAKKKMEDCEKKVKQAEEVLRAAKSVVMYAS